MFSDNESDDKLPQAAAAAGAAQAGEAPLFLRENTGFFLRENTGFFSNKKKDSVLKGILKKNRDPERRRTTHKERVQKLRVKFFPSSPLTVTSSGKKSADASPKVAPASATATPAGTPVDPPNPPLSKPRPGRAAPSKVVAQSADANNARAPPAVIVFTISGNMHYGTKEKSG